MAGVYNDSSPSLDIYINGVLNNGVLANVIPSSQTLNPGVNVNIGRRTGGFYFNGLIDEVRVYDRVLSASEIQADMSTAVTGTSPSLSGTAIDDFLDIASDHDNAILSIERSGADLILIVSGASSSSYTVKDSDDLLFWRELNVVRLDAGHDSLHPSHTGRTETEFRVPLDQSSSQKFYRLLRIP